MSAYATHCPRFRKVNLALSSRPAPARSRMNFAKTCDPQLLSGDASAFWLKAMFELEGLDHIALAVRDVERSAKWYVDVLGFERRFPGMWEGVPLFVGKGRTAIALFPLAGDQPSAPVRAPGSVLHFALRADRRNFLAAQRDLTSREIAFHFQDHEISQSIYFQDPDGYEVEITTYEVE